MGSWTCGLINCGLFHCWLNLYKQKLIKVLPHLKKKKTTTCHWFDPWIFNWTLQQSFRGASLSNPVNYYARIYKQLLTSPSWHFFLHLVIFLYHQFDEVFPWTLFKFLGFSEVEAIITNTECSIGKNKHRLGLGIDNRFQFRNWILKVRNLKLVLKLKFRFRLCVPILMWFRTIFKRKTRIRHLHRALFSLRTESHLSYSVQ